MKTSVTEVFTSGCLSEGFHHHYRFERVVGKCAWATRQVTRNGARKVILFNPPVYQTTNPDISSLPDSHPIVCLNSSQSWRKISFQLYLFAALFRQLFSGASGGPAGGQTFEKFDKQHPKPAFKVAHLAAGGSFSAAYCGVR